MKVGSCNIKELELVGQGKPNPTNQLLYNSFMSKAKGFSQPISLMYRAAGIDPVGRPNVYACPKDWQAVIVDRRTNYKLEMIFGAILAVLIILYVIVR